MAIAGFSALRLVCGFVGGQPSVRLGARCRRRGAGAGVLRRSSPTSTSSLSRLPFPHDSIRFSLLEFVPGAAGLAIAIQAAWITDVVDVNAILRAVTSTTTHGVIQNLTLALVGSRHHRERENASPVNGKTVA